VPFAGACGAAIHPVPGRRNDLIGGCPGAKLFFLKGGNVYVNSGNCKWRCAVGRSVSAAADG